MPGMSGMSSAVRGLIPKSTGGRMAMGGTMGIAAGVAGATSIRRSYRNNKQTIANNSQAIYAPYHNQ